MQPWIWFLFVFASHFVLAANFSLSTAAEYYFSKHDFGQALSLWQEVYKSQPNSVDVAIKVSELRFLLEGHEAAQKTLIEFLQEKRNFISPLKHEKLNQKLTEMQNRFFRDDSQSFYYQSLSKIKLGDFNQALVLLNQADQLERGNSKVLELKARCEKQLGQYSKYYETLKTSQDLILFNSNLIDNFLEGAYYFKDYSNILNWLELHSTSPISPRQRIAIAMAYLEKGEFQKAETLFYQLVSDLGPGPNHPIIWYGLGRALSNRPVSRLKMQYWEKFIKSAAEPGALILDGWDPYRTIEKVTEANKWLTELAQEQ